MSAQRVGCIPYLAHLRWGGGVIPYHWGCSFTSRILACASHNPLKTIVNHHVEWIENISRPSNRQDHQFTSVNDESGLEVRKRTPPDDAGGGVIGVGGELLAGEGDAVC